MARRAAVWSTVGCIGGASLLALSGCARVTVDPIEVKPIHITADINLRIERELDEFFAFEKKYEAPATQPQTASGTSPAATQPIVQ